MNERMKQDRENQLQILKKVEAEAERFFEQRNTGKALPFWDRKPLRSIGEQGMGAEASLRAFSQGAFLCAGQPPRVPWGFKNRLHYTKSALVLQAENSQLDFPDTHTNPYPAGPAILPETSCFR